MGNCLSQDEKAAIEVIVPVLDRVTPKEIAEHPAVSLISTQFRDADQKDCDLLLKALKLPRQQKRHGKRQPQTQTSQCERGEDLRAVLADKGVKKPFITTRVNQLLALIQDIINVEKHPSYKPKLSEWNEDARNLWRSQSSCIFVGHGKEGVNCVRSLYCGLDQVQQDDYVGAVRRRFILIMLVRLRDRVTTCAVLLGKPKSGQTTKSSALNWIVSAIGSQEDGSTPDSEKDRKLLRHLLIAGNSYLKILKVLGMGFLFLLGGMASRRLWETRINSNDIEVLSNHLQKELPNIVERAKGLHNLALNVFEAGLKECGWIAWEETQRANINVTRSQKGYDHLTFIEHFLGGKVSVGDINGDSHQKRRRENKDSPQKRLCILSSSEACLSPRSHSTSEDTGLGEPTIPSRRASNSSPPNNLLIDIPSSRSHTTASRETLQFGDTESQYSCRASAADPSDMIMRSDIVAANQSLSMCTVTSPPKSTVGIPENLQSSDSEFVIAFEQAHGFMSEYAPGDIENAFEQAPGFMSEYAPGDFENAFEQAPGFMSEYAPGDFENAFEQAPGFMSEFAPGDFENAFEQAPGFMDLHPGDCGSLIDKGTAS